MKVQIWATAVPPNLVCVVISFGAGRVMMEGQTMMLLTCASSKIAGFYMGLNPKKIRDVSHSWCRFYDVSYEPKALIRPRGYRNSSPTHGVDLFSNGSSRGTPGTWTSIGWLLRLTLRSDCTTAMDLSVILSSPCQNHEMKKDFLNVSILDFTFLLVYDLISPPVHLRRGICVCVRHNGIFFLFWR